MSGSITACSRLQRECGQLMREPLPFISAAPLPHDILDWRYVISGPPATPFQGGIYYGKLIFSPDYPFKPPSIYMMTPNGRFKVNKRLCFSMSDYHPSHWDPAWTVSNILLGVLSFMLEDAPTYGSIETTDLVKRQMARQSQQFNAEKSDEWFPYLFPDIFSHCSVDAKHNADEGLKEEKSACMEHAVVVVPDDDVVVQQKHCDCQPSDLTVFLVPLAVFLCLLLVFLILVFVLGMN